MENASNFLGAMSTTENKCMYVAFAAGGCAGDIEKESGKNRKILFLMKIGVMSKWVLYLKNFLSVFLHFT